MRSRTLWLSGPMATLHLMAVTIALGQDIVAHRGASHDAPENTLAAFRLAWQQGADAIEGDFYLSQDGHIVCLHDRSTRRVAGVDLDVTQSTLDQLQQLDVGSWKHPRFAGEKIPTLPQVLALVPPGKYILIEIKSGPEIVPALQRVLAEADLEPWQTKVIAFDAEVVAQVKRRMPEIEAFWLTSYRQDKETRRWTPTRETILQTLRRINADGLDTHARREVITPSFISQLREAGFSVHTWTVNDPDDARWLQSLGVDSITTDRPEWLRSNVERSTSNGERPTSNVQRSTSNVERPTSNIQH